MRKIQKVGVKLKPVTENQLKEPLKKFKLQDFVFKFNLQYWSDSIFRF